MLTALSLLLTLSCGQEAPASRPALRLHSGVLGATVGLDGELRGLGDHPAADAPLMTAAISVAGAGWQELRDLKPTARLDEDSEVLVISHALVTVRVALPRGGDALAYGFEFPRPTRLRLRFADGAPATLAWAVDTATQPVETDGRGAAVQTEPVTAARLVVLRAGEAPATAAALGRALAGCDSTVERALGDGPTWLSAGVRVVTQEPDFDLLLRRCLLQLRTAEAWTTAAKTPGSEATARMAMALAWSGHAVEATRLLTPAAPDAVGTAAQLMALRVVAAVSADPALQQEAHSLSTSRALALVAPLLGPEFARRGLRSWFADASVVTAAPAATLLAGLAASAPVLGTAHPLERAALTAALPALRERLATDAWRADLSRLVPALADPDGPAGVDSELLELCTPSLWVDDVAVLSAWDERMEATNARLLDRLLSRDGLLGSAGEWRSRGTFAPGSPHPAVAASCRLLARRLLLGDTEGARRVLVALVRRSAAPGSHPLRLLPAGWHEATGAALTDATPEAAAAFALAALQFLVGAQPPPDPQRCDLVIAPSFPEDWRVSRVVNHPDPKGSFDLELVREDKDVRLRLTRRRGEAVRILVRHWKSATTRAETLVELAPGKPVELRLTAPTRPTFRLVPGEPIVLPAAPAALVQRILAWTTAERLLANRDLGKDLQRQEAPFAGDVDAYADAVEVARRQLEARFEQRRAAGR